MGTHTIQRREWEFGEKREREGGAGERWGGRERERKHNMTINNQVLSMC